MPVPYQDFPASQATVDLGTGVISYEEAGALAASGEVLGGAIAAAETAAAAAVLAEPLLIIGAGVAAGMAADAILNKIAPTATKPQYNRNRASGGRIGGGVTVNFKYKPKGESELTNAIVVPAPYQGTTTRQAAFGETDWYVVAAGALFGLASGAPANFDEPPTVTSVVPNSAGTGDPINYAPTWVNPGTGALPVPVPVSIPAPGGDPIDITPQVYPSPKNLPTAQPGQPVQPGIFVFMPEIGLAINFSPTNVTLIFTMPADSPLTQAPPANQYPVPTLPQNPCLCPPYNDAKILCLLRELETKLIIDGYDYTTHTGSIGQTGKVTGVTDELFSVELEVGTVPASERVQFFPSPSPNVYFFGWFTWLTGDLPGHRNPISFTSNTFKAPPGASGYLFGLHDLCSATSTYTTRKPKAFTSEC